MKLLVSGTGWERTPWHATQRAAWEALMKADPFHAAGVFVRWTVRPWKMVFANPSLMQPA